MQLVNHLNKTSSTMTCDDKEVLNHLQKDYSSAAVHILITVSAVAIFIGTRHVFCKIRDDMSFITVLIVGAGPIGLTTALIATQSKRVQKVIVFEDDSRHNVENRSYQICVSPPLVSFLRSYHVDFDNLEGIWNDGCFYTRVGIYLEYIINILPIYQTNIDLRFGSKVMYKISDKCLAAGTC